MLERAERFTHRHAAGAEAAAELALGRKLVAALEAAVVDRALDVSDDVVVHARRADGRKHGATVRRKEPEVKRGKVPEPAGDRWQHQYPMEYRAFG